MSSLAYLKEFYDVVSSRYPREGQEMSYAQWISENTKLRGKPYSFKGFEFQIAIANDMSQSLSVIKPSQVGLTEIQIRKFLAFLARNRGTSGIFTLPNEKMYKRLSKTRFKPLIESERAFASFADEEKASRSMDLYEINGSFAYLTGMSEGDATSIPADMLCHDELDLSDQVNIGLFQSRLQASKWRLTHRFSTPTLPGFAIDASYAVSDQHEYMCKCSSCGHHQIPMFDIRFLKIPGYTGEGKLTDMTDEEYERINLEGIEIICEACSRPLDVLNPEMREWVPRYPSRKTRGYRVRPMMNEALMPAYIINQLFEMRRLDNMKGFFNTVLGEPFSDGSNQLTDEQIKKCLKSPNAPTGEDFDVAVGIDVGRVCHVTIGRIVGDVVWPFRFELIEANQIEEFVKHLCQKYRVVAGCMDRYPYTPTADAVFTASNKKIIPVEYKSSSFINLKRDEFGDVSYVQINRTATLDRVANLIRRQMMPIYGFGAYEELLKTHLKDMVRVEDGEKDATWIKVTGNDHFFHSLGYLQIAPRVFTILDSISSDSIEENRTMTGIYGIQSRADTRSSDIYQTKQRGNRDLF